MRRGAIAFVALALWAALGAGAQGPPEPPDPAADRAPDPRDAALEATLNAARGAIETRRYDRALALLRPVLADPALLPKTRTEALFLRAWANAARGRLAQADADWRGVLALRPDFEPEPGTLSEKARTRFRSVRAAVVGRVRVVVDPDDAEVRVDGALASRAADGSIAVPIGPHVVVASRVGFDSAEQALNVEGDRTAEVRLELVPNAGAIVIRTIPDGVTVRLDGEPVGITAFPPATTDGSAVGEAAELALERVQLGEHRVELAKPCHRVTTLRVSVDANLLERSARRIGPVVLEPARGNVVLRGGPADADVFIDGERVGKLSPTPFSRCPGRARIEVRAGPRLVWGESAELGLDAELVLDVSPRPNVLLYGAEDWPAPFARIASTLGWRAAGELPAGTNPSTIEGWRAVALAEDIDLVVAFVPATERAPESRWLLMSAVLGTVEPLAPAVDPDRPRWSGGDLGVEVADSRIGGPARVVRVTAGGPAARGGIVVGDRIVEAARHPIESAGQLRAAIDAAPSGAPLALRVERRSGGIRSVQIEPLARARPIALASVGGAAAIAAAWARVDAATLPREEAAGAYANLATLLARAGRHAEAALAWEAVLRIGASSVCRGSAAYESGVELEAIGRSAEANEAFRSAAESTCAAFDAPEALVAPAARARLDRADDPTSTSR